MALFSKSNRRKLRKYGLVETKSLNNVYRTRLSEFTKEVLEL